NQRVDPGNFRERFEARFRHGDDAEVRFDGAKGIVLRRRLVRTGDGVEQRGFTHVGQTDDSSFEHNGFAGKIPARVTFDVWPTATRYVRRRIIRWRAGKRRKSAPCATGSVR